MTNLTIINLINNFTLPLNHSVHVFAILLAIILFVPIILKRINVPNIIGLIIAGVIIGPYGLNLIDNHHQGVSMFSTIGLLYIMFIVGLELDLNEFLANKNKSIVFGFFTFIIPISIGFPVCYYLLGYDFNASFLTASMFATHTLVTYPIVSRLGVAKNQAVAITVGGTILTDTAVLIILALILSNTDGGINTIFLIKLALSVIVFFAIVFLLIPRIAKWFFQKGGGEKYSHYIFVLFIIFFCGFLAELCGLEAIIGAFTAGLALNRLIPHSSALMNRIDFFGNSLFIPIFLISVGMLVNISVVFNGMTTIIIAGILTITALLGKWFAAFFTQIIFKYSTIQRNIIFGLSSSRAAATIVIIIVGYNAGIVDEYILNGTIVLILLTCIVASFVTQASAKKLAVIQENAPLTASELGAFGQEKILVPIANPSNIGHHVELALLIKDKSSVNSISLLGVVPNNEAAEKNIISFKKQLQDFIDNATAAEIDVDTITTIDHNAANGIVRTARELMTDIIILGWPGKTGVLEKLLGDKVDLIIKNVDRNLFICHIEQDFINHKRIVVISPPLVEKETGFNLWLAKIVRLSQELSIPILHLGDPKTQEIIANTKNLSAPFTFQPLVEWQNPVLYGDIIKDNDMIIMVSAHQGYISYMPVLDHLPTRLEERYPHHSRIVVYPKQRTIEGLLESDDSIFVPSNF
ncbi:MAG: cation:proton antiporter [Ignavibacteria bacterium]|jgi:Kef-type K+ transport system membrane component KefB|nr:cation:proton antiporter [Ignavibacteria bacterium]